MIGTALKTELADHGHQVRCLTRSPGGDYQWTALPGSVPGEAVDWADALVSLNGASLTHLPWTAAYRRLIESSRVDATAALAQAVRDCENPPSVWVSGSAVGFYGDRGEEQVDESSPPGDSFLATVVQAWEQAARPALGHTRVVWARTGIVLGPEGALKPLAAVTRVGLGARLGSGAQWWPWVSLADEVRAMEFALGATSLAGPIDIVSPVPARAHDISRAVARILRRPHVMRVPAVVLRSVLGGADELLLASQRVAPTALLDAGFQFEHTDVVGAIRAAWGSEGAVRA